MVPFSTAFLIRTLILFQSSPSFIPQSETGLPAERRQFGLLEGVETAQEL
jgi:hypothetical protein